MVGKDGLIERTRKTVGDRGQMRLAADHWREMGEPEEIVYDLVELEDGSLEVRLRVE
ncbi:hypothetical protein [Natrinema salsiterrestre]|uniref:Uncharacterized protein n=1 Tax=Natrinema salsiterrestre TaxID=2950540 RepID=A0A9Q4L4R6_9EURY|nr:hypothetical protein [Natrinema salsiterrestre]MDF9748311.1 hypothetical protein [Natrinema salsiterrestre]